MAEAEFLAKVVVEDAASLYEPTAEAGF
jgi:hypothetical protein